LAEAWNAEIFCEASRIEASADSQVHAPFLRAAAAISGIAGKLCRRTTWNSLKSEESQFHFIRWPAQ
jgi:hypothetical protein